MTAIGRTPVNTNLLQSTKFQLIFPNIKNMTFFCQDVSIPGVSINELPQTTPFVNLARPGQKITYDEFTVRFMVNEDLSSWLDIHNWIRGMADPVTFPQLSTTEKYTDGTLLIYSNLNNPKFKVEFKNMFPHTLSELEFSTKNSADDIMTASVTFRYDYYDFVAT